MKQEAVEVHVDARLARLSLREKVGQLNQRLYGWQAVRRGRHGWEPTEELLAEIERWHGLGAIYGLFRADAWSGRTWRTGIPFEERGEVAALVTDIVVRASGAGIPPLIVEEAPHGHQALGATGFPVALNAGSTWDPELYAECSRAVAAELRAGGVHLALVSALDLLRDPRWGRAEECYGEDPLLAAEMCRALVTGMQGVGRSRLRDGSGVGVVLKHFAAQGEGLGGRNGHSATIGARDLAELHLPAARAGVAAGALGVMAAYNDIDGVPCCADPGLLTDLLRGEWGFDGLVMADGKAIDRLVELTGSPVLAAVAALEAGVDLSLWDESFTLLEDAVERWPAVGAAVDTATRRVLQVKAELGLLDATAPPTPRADRRESIRLSRALAARSLVLLTNDGTLPLTALAPDAPGGSAAVRPAPGASGTVRPAPAHPRVAVVGPNAHSITALLGDYVPPLADGATGSLVDALRDAVGDRATVVAPPAGTYDDPAVLAQVVHGADVVIVALGGTSHRSAADAFADNGAISGDGAREATCGEGVDLASIDLPGGQDDLVARLRSLTSAPLVSVVVAGRPHVLTGVCRDSNAALLAWYPGPHGAAAVADALLGVADPSGCLPVTLAASAAVLPVRYNDRQVADGVYRDEPTAVLFSFGHGLGYHAPPTQTLAVRPGPAPGEIEIAVTVSSRNDRDVAHTVQVYAQRRGGVTWPRRRELVAFRRTIVPAHGAVTESFRLTGSAAFAEGAGSGAETLLFTSAAPTGRPAQIVRRDPDAR